MVNLFLRSDRLSIDLLSTICKFDQLTRNKTPKEIQSSFKHETANKQDFDRAKNRRSKITLKAVFYSPSQNLFTNSDKLNTVTFLVTEIFGRIFWNSLQRSLKKHHHQVLHKFSWHWGTTMLVEALGALGALGALEVQWWPDAVGSSSWSWNVDETAKKERKYLDHSIFLLRLKASKQFVTVKL